MKNLILVLALLVSSYSYAYSTKYFNIHTGQTKLVDVANQKNIISLKWDVLSTDGFIVPSAQVLNQEGDFQCQIKKTILLFSGYNQEAKLWSQTWEIKVEWSPGTDQSGCLVEVSHPDEGSSYAKLYLNYNLGLRFIKKDTPDEGNDSCETYECDNGNGRGDGYGDPDGTSDGPTRDGGGDGYDGGGYDGI